MREKHLFKFATMLIAVLMGLAMVMSCSKDDDDGNGNGNGNHTETDGLSNDNGGSTDSSISFQYGDIIPDRVLASPMQYGFSMDTVLVVYSYNYGSGRYSFYYEDVAWVDERGCFIVGSDKWNNTYIRFYYNQSNNIRTDNGVIVMDGKERYAMYDDGELFVAIIPDQNVEIRKVLFSDSGTTTTSHQGPFYNAAIDALETSAIYFDLYTDDFSIDDVQATTSSSWLTVSKIMLNYKKGDIASGESTYDHSRGSIWWYTSENTTGSDRVGYIYVTLKVDGETINHTLEVTQLAYSSGGSGSGSGSDSGSGSGGGSDKYTNWSKVNFQNSYNKYAQLAESTWKSYSQMKSGNSSYASLSSLRSTYRDIQSDMRELREAAADAGYTIAKSEWETKSLP